MISLRLMTGDGSFGVTPVMLGADAATVIVEEAV